MKIYVFKTIVFYSENSPVKNYGFKTMFFYKVFEGPWKALKAHEGPLKGPQKALKARIRT